MTTKIHKASVNGQALDSVGSKLFAAIFARRLSGKLVKAALETTLPDWQDDDVIIVDGVKFSGRAFKANLTVALDNAATVEDKKRAERMLSGIVVKTSSSTSYNASVYRPVTIVVAPPASSRGK